MKPWSQPSRHEKGGMRVERGKSKEKIKIWVNGGQCRGLCSNRRGVRIV